MVSIPLDLDGYTDLPPGKIANVVTYLELTTRRGPVAAVARPDLAFRRVEEPDPDWYRRLFRAVGEEWLWFPRQVISRDALASYLADPAIEVFVVEDSDGEAIGLSELVRGAEGDVEVALFGVVDKAIGTGAAQRLMDETLVAAFAAGTERVWLHTCTFDHPAAVRFYLRFGFRAWKFAVEVSHDPRLMGAIPETAAPHVPLIKPEAT